MRTPKVWRRECSGLKDAFKSSESQRPPSPSHSSPTMTPYAGGDNADAILSISQCRMTPQGVASIIHHLKQHPLFADVHEERLRAMAFAFLAYGGTNDNNHAIDIGSLHRIHYEANRTSRHGCWRNNMCESYVALVMDLVSSFLSAAEWSLTHQNTSLLGSTDSRAARQS